MFNIGLNYKKSRVTIIQLWDPKNKKTTFSYALRPRKNCFGRASGCARRRSGWWVVWTVSSFCAGTWLWRCAPAAAAARPASGCKWRARRRTPAWADSYAPSPCGRYARPRTPAEKCSATWRRRRWRRDGLNRASRRCARPRTRAGNWAWTWRWHAQHLARLRSDCLEASNARSSGNLRSPRHFQPPPHSILHFLVVFFSCFASESTPTSSWLREKLLHGWIWVLPRVLVSKEKRSSAAWVRQQKFDLCRCFVVLARRYKNSALSNRNSLILRLETEVLWHNFPQCDFKFPS